MATDHRGRQLHAGKRTNKEMADAYAKANNWRPKGTYDEDISNRTDYVKGGVPSNSRVNLVVHPNFNGTHTWITQTEDVTHPVDTSDEELGLGMYEGPPSIDLGRGKISKSYPKDYGKPRFTHGEAKTPMRAMIAAEAMKKRIEEGRDLKTGR